MTKETARILHLRGVLNDKQLEEVLTDIVVPIFPTANMNNDIGVGYDYCIVDDMDIVESYTRAYANG